MPGTYFDTAQCQGSSRQRRSKSGLESVASESGGGLSGESPHSAFTFSRRI